MFIHEAVRLAMKLGINIVRRDDIQHLRITPTNSDEGFIITGKNQAPRPRWQPRAEDLMADDWIVTPAKLEESPSDIPGVT